jgi:hypothetical protein
MKLLTALKFAYLAGAGVVALTYTLSGLYDIFFTQPYGLVERLLNLAILFAIYGPVNVVLWPVLLLTNGFDVPRLLVYP